MGSALMRPTAATATRPQVIELVGPAGAGKSTAVMALRARDARVRTDLALWGQPPALLLRTALRVARRLNRWLSAPWGAHEPAALAQMVRTDALRDAVDMAAVPGTPPVIMDEGPVFALTWLEVFHGHHDRAVARWRRQALADWAARLNCVVVFDAPDAVLAQRIRERAKPHLVKAWPDRAVVDFIGRFRHAFDRVLGELQAEEPVAVEVLDTTEMGPQQSADRILTLLRLTGRVA